MFAVDKIFVNGMIYTMEHEGDYVQAIAVYDGKIIDIGTNEQIQQYTADEVIDLKGKTVLPGFIDTHCHIAEAVEGQLKVDLSGANTVDEVLKRLEIAVKLVEPGKWLFGFQISERSIGRLPDRYELDKISTEIPILISENGLHSFIGNSILLETLGITKEFDKPGCEFIDRDENSEPTGIFREHGMLPYINEKRPSIFSSKKQMKEELKKRLSIWNSYGFTTLHSCDGFSNSVVDQMSTFQELERDHELTMRIILNKQNAVDNTIGAISGAGDDYVKYGAFKIFIDGSFSARSALLLEDYMDAPGCKGRTARSFAETRELISSAYRKGNDLAIHVIGDGGMNWVLKILEEIYDPNKKQQFALIHVSLTNEDQWDKLSEYPVVIETQPIFLPDMEHSKQYRLGEERGNHLMAYRSWMNHGIIVAGGEDGPIYSSNPFESMYFAITRKIGEKLWLNPDESISTYQAVEMYTKNASYCAHEENKKGTITCGKLADFIVLEDDIFHMSPDQIRKLTVWKTYLSGEQVYSK